ncbi:MAG TPA: hypothetical protein VNE63_13740 [Candidatus Acidoferrales bacterium]|nr:hypothetical protein [Candidatus Acidoferrales bacterium]
MAKENRAIFGPDGILAKHTQRVLGVPLPLDSLELGEMVEWTMQLGPSFPEAVEAVWIGPKFELKNSPLLSELADNELSKRHPTPAAKLLLRVLQNTQVAPYDLDKVEETVRRVAPLQAPSDTLSDICNELARLGYPDAAKLQTWLQGGNFQ